MSQVAIRKSGPAMQASLQEGRCKPSELEYDIYWRVENTSWPNKCACGTIFKTKDDLLSHPAAYRFERPTSSSELSRALLCSDEVMAYKKQNGIDAGMLMVATGQGDGLLSSAMREMTSLLTEAKLPPPVWPKKCGCGAIFNEEPEVRDHPITYREVESKTSSAVQRVLACSEEVLNYKKTKGWETSNAVIIRKTTQGTKRQLEEPQAPAKTMKSSRVADWPNRCNCGAKFNTKADLLAHSTVYRFVRSKTTSELHRILFCSEEVLIYKSQMTKDANTSESDEEEEVKVETPKFPSKCKCKAKFASKTDVLNHLTTYNFGTADAEAIRCRSSCSGIVVTFKKCQLADPGYQIQRNNRFPYVGPSLIKDESMRRCDCGAKFKLMKDIFEHTLAFESNHKWASHPWKIKVQSMCSPKIIEWKRDRRAICSYVVRNTPQPPPPKDANWPTECKCGAYFPNLESVRDHPVVYTPTKARIVCSSEVVIFKAKLSVIAGDFVRRPSHQSRSCSAEILDESLKKCDCGAQFEWNMDIANHPIVVESDRVVCSEQITAFKNKLRADPGTWFRPTPIQEEEEEKQLPIPEFRPTIQEEEKQPPIPEEKEIIVPVTTMPMIPATPPNSVDDIEWPHECDCNAGTSFPTLDSVLEHLEMRDDSGTSLCSPVMNAFKKQRGANPGFMVCEDNHAAELVEDEEITDPRLKQCECGSNFDSLTEILFHPTVYIQYTDGTNKTLMCSADILRTKTIHHATPGYVVYNYTKEELEDAKPAVVIQCEHCPEQGFKTPIELADHMLKHETPLYECVCGRHFIHKRDAVAHTKMYCLRSNVSHRIKCHKCMWPECDEEFLSFVGLRLHLLTHNFTY